MDKRWRHKTHQGAEPHRQRLARARGGMQQAAAAFGDGLPDFELEWKGAMAAGGEPVGGPAEIGVNALGRDGGGAGHAALSVLIRRPQVGRNP